MAAEFVRYDEDCGQEPFTLRLESAGEPTRCASDTSPHGHGGRLPARATACRSVCLELSQSERIAQVTALRAEQAKRRGAYPVSYAQLRLWLLDRTDPGNAAYNIVRAFRLAGPLDAAVLERSIGAIVARHAPLRTTFRFVDGQPVQIPGIQTGRRSGS